MPEHKGGTLTFSTGKRDRRSLEERFKSNYEVREDGCWAWTGALDGNGYGVMRHLGSVRAHRYSFQMSSGTADCGEIDHACRNRRCVNPEHLREVSRAQNSQNQATLRPTKSDYRGVAWHEASKSWHVVAVLHGKQYSGGYFKDVHAAGKAAIELRNKLYTHNEEDRRSA